MRHIYQRYASDCFPTCIAIVANISHNFALKLLNPFHKKGSSYESQDDDAIRILRFLGFKVRKRFIKDFTTLTQPAILAISVDDENFGHVVVWDPETKQVLDPSRGDRYGISHYKKRLRYVFILS
jgi:hypothetical protein